MLPIKNYRSKLLSPVFALAAAAGLWLCATAQADNYATYMEQFGARKLPVGIRIPGGQQEWLLSKMDGTMLEVSLANGDTMAFDSADPTLVNRLVLQTPPSTQIGILVNSGNAEEALRLLRPEIYPLLRFRTLPVSYEQVFEPIDLLLGTLTAGQKYVEAAEILSNNTELLVQERFQRRILSLVEALIQEGSTTEAVNLLTLIPLESVPEGLKNALMSFAYKLRVRGEYESLISVYRQLIPLLDGLQKAEAEIWLAYCLINTGKQQEGDEILAQMPVPQPSDETFGLYQLLTGYNLFRANEFAKALDVFSRGLVYASSVDVWIPEITYYIGNCYRHLGKTDTARNAYEEIFKLYPDNLWAKRAKAAYDEIAAGVAVQAQPATAISAPASAPAADSAPSAPAAQAPQTVEADDDAADEEGSRASEN